MSQSKSQQDKPTPNDPSHVSLLLNESHKPNVLVVVHLSIQKRKEIADRVAKSISSSDGISYHMEDDKATHSLVLKPLKTYQHITLLLHVKDAIETSGFTFQMHRLNPQNSKAYQFFYTLSK
eukprot:34686_1